MASAGAGAAGAVTVELLGLDPATYEPHPLHSSDRLWQETNCAADLWIECLHALKLDPSAGLAFTLSTDFDGDQWRMFTFPPEDLRRLYGIEADELNVWRTLTDHVEEQLALGHLVMVDVDAWHLPDTAGLTYRQAHQKTSVMVQMIDTEAQRLGYFHNAGYFELEGEDFAGLLGTGAAPALPPFVLSVRLEHLRHDDVAPLALSLAAEHLARQPASNPVRRMAKRMEEDVAWLAHHDVETFHRYAFGTLRQCGANAELAASFAAWLGSTTGEDTSGAVEGLGQVAAGMKTAEFLAARAVRGRGSSLAQTLSEMAEAWESAMGELSERCGH